MQINSAQGANILLAQLPDILPCTRTETTVSEHTTDSPRNLPAMRTITALQTAQQLADSLDAALLFDLDWNVLSHRAACRAMRATRHVTGARLASTRTRQPSGASDFKIL